MGVLSLPFLDFGVFIIHVPFFNPLWIEIEGKDATIYIILIFLKGYSPIRYGISIILLLSKFQKIIIVSMDSLHRKKDIVICLENILENKGKCPKILFLCF